MYCSIEFRLITMFLGVCIIAAFVVPCVATTVKITSNETWNSGDQYLADNEPSAYNTSSEIPPGPATVLPDYIGKPAKSNPLSGYQIPQNPFLAPNSFSQVHSDAWQSDTEDVSGPLGKDPVALSSSMTQARSGSIAKTFQCGCFAFDSSGHVIMPCLGMGETSLVMADPKTLDVLSVYNLATVQKENSVLDALGNVYFYLDHSDKLVSVNGSSHIVILNENLSSVRPAFERYKEYDISTVLGADDRIRGVNPDWKGRIWFAISGSNTTPAGIGVFDQEKYMNASHGQQKVKQSAGSDGVNPVMYPYVKVLKFGKNERISNTIAVSESGVYVVTSEKMYCVWALDDNQPYVVWSEPYDTIGSLKPGQYSLGSGTTPTIVGNGQYVAITDNADPLKIVVFRTDEKLKANETRIAVEAPVFEKEAGGANEDSIIGYNLSLIVGNNYNYAFNFSTLNVTPSLPGMERVDIVPNGTDCSFRKVWTNPEIVSVVAPKLSTKNGLIYTVATKTDKKNGVLVYYWTAIDFDTGRVVWQKYAGTGYAYDNYYQGIGIGQDNIAYLGVYGGVIWIMDQNKPGS